MEERAKKSFNITALKEWEEAGEPFEEDDVILAYLEYKRNEARKNGANPGTSQNLSPPGSLSLGKEEKKERERDEWERRKRKGGIMTIYGVSRGNQKSASFNSRTYAYATTAVNNLQSSPPIMIAFSQTKAALPPSRQTLAAVTKKNTIQFYYKRWKFIISIL
ncbi:hypothetical protein RhiirA1_397251 [Rhizophagus irregularis]|uniref:Uncharacterized protein n=1 Tax=Rhizophagus irregularis TaxID=588596 RepID=A0A2N0RHZ3_9GLOM|nr:hypothetical protein RhiirA1_397251 [Rhizophagus irregularis]